MQRLAQRLWLFAVLLAALGQFVPFWGHFCPMQAAAQPLEKPAKYTAQIECAMCPQSAPVAQCLPCCVQTGGAVWTSTPLLASSKTELPAPQLAVASTPALAFEAPLALENQIFWHEADLPPPRPGAGFPLSSRGPPVNFSLA